MKSQLYLFASLVALTSGALFAVLMPGSIMITIAGLGGLGFSIAGLRGK